MLYIMLILYVTYFRTRCFGPPIQGRLPYCLSVSREIINLDIYRVNYSTVLAEYKWNSSVINWMTYIIVHK